MMAEIAATAAAHTLRTGWRERPRARRCIARRSAVGRPTSCACVARDRKGLRHTHSGHGKVGLIP